MPDRFPSLSDTLTRQIPTLSQTKSLKMVPLSGGAAASPSPPPLPPHTEGLLELFRAQICSVLNHVNYYNCIKVSDIIKTNCLLI